MRRRSRLGLIAAIAGVGGVVLVVLAASGAHKSSSRGSHDPWASAAIAAGIILVVAALALLVGARMRRDR